MPNLRTIAGWTRACAASLALALCALAPSAIAAPPAGTVITNQAEGSALIGGAPFNRTSNTVQLTTSGAPVPSGSATLVNGQTLRLAPGGTVYFVHTLTNTGATPDTYALAVTPLAGTYDLTAVAIFADANGDGQPDSATPVAGPVALAPGQAFRFVVRATAPANAPPDGVDRLQVSAQSTAPGAPAPLVNLDVAAIFVDIPPPPPQNGLSIFKAFSVIEGPSPFESILVTIRYANSNTDTSAKRDFTILDGIAEGFAYVPGSARWSGSGPAPLTDAAGGDPAGIRFDFGATMAGAVWATVERLGPGDAGELTFRLNVAPGRRLDERLANVARYRWVDPSGAETPWRDTNIVDYLVTGTIDVLLTGDRIPVGEPGTTVAFANVLTNRGTVAEVFNILLGASTFPPGTAIRLYAQDGTTPLADTNGDGVPDVGIVAPGQSVRVVVKVDLPSTLLPGEYAVQKTAQSVRAPARRSTATDTVASVAVACRLVLDNDNRGRVPQGGAITYVHRLRNTGNCVESANAATGFLADTLAGWTSQAVVDNESAGGASLPGLVDATDTAIAAGWSVTLQPGEARRILVRVQSPAAAGSSQAPPAAKAQGDANRTTLSLGSTRGPLANRDDTVIDDTVGTGTPDDVIRNFGDPSYRVPTIWAVIGRDVYLRADTPSCNARPDAIETRIVRVTGPNGEREDFVATETGPNTGVFVVSSIPVRNPPVVPGDGILQGRPYDTMDAEILGCGRRIATTITLIDPSGVVFDSGSNAPVEGATVSLVTAAGGRCSTTLATVRAIERGELVASRNPVTTGADGRYDFPVVAPGEYCLAVATPNGYAWVSAVPFNLLAPGRNLHVTGPTSGGSYGSPFRLGPEAGPVVVDIPVDPVPLSGLFVQKAASRAVAELGEFVDYVVRVRNASGRALDAADVRLTDDLPAGFAFVPGSARRGTTPLADPAGGRGPRLVFGLGRLAAAEEALVSYRVRIGPGAMQGDGINRVQASYRAGGTASLSNVATATVVVNAGVFTDRGYILGRVYLDCNANGRQDEGESGVPGVRLFLEDGTNATTDGEGKYSFYGITHRTHVLKVDRSTVPAGGRLAANSGRHAGDPGSRFVDLKAGELHRADFTLSTCEAPVRDEVLARREAAMKQESTADQLVGQKLEVERAPIADVKALPASGVLGVAATDRNPAVAPAASGFQPVEPAAARFREKSATVKAAAPAPVVDLEKLVPGLDGKLAFLGLADGDTLPYAQATVRVKGEAGAQFHLLVNGQAVPDSRVGKRAVLAETKVQAWEYIGIDLKPGRNELVLQQADGFGNPRGRVAITVVAPGALGRLALELPAGAGTADGRSGVRVVVKLLDEAGVPVTSRTPVTLETSRGTWQAEDLNAQEPGTQVFVEGGRGEFFLGAPSEPGEAKVRAASGPLKAEATIDFLPELRQMIAVGVVEGTINLRNLDPRSLVPSRAGDGFEQELRHFSRTANDGRTQVGARAAFFLKGVVKGEFLLTAAYDSDKPTRERLFRDIQPDEFYPVYGDASQRGFDAQSTSRLYVRVDHRKSYLLFGDFTTQGQGEARKLSGYTRSLTGAKLHWENARVSANAFASRDSTRQVIDELRANGTSGPYALGTGGALVNSERVEILTRDRSQPAIVLQSVPQSRFFDYEIEPLTGRILFKAPVPSVDPNLNPVSIRITYEVDQGGPEFWVAGADAQVRVTDRVEVGASYVEDRNPADPMTLAGVNATVKLAERTFLFAEAAQTDHEKTVGKGQGARLELKHESERLQANAYVVRTDASFDNPGAYLGKGRGESGGKATWKLDDKTLVRAEMLRTEDVATNAVRDGVMASVERRLDNRMTVELGVRYAQEKNGAAPPAGTGGLASEGLVPDHVTTVRGRLTGPLPFLEGASVYGEGEFDVEDAGRRILALGGEYTLPNRGKAYFRHEFVSSITGPYGLNAKERQNTSVFGVDTEYMRDGRLFSEYRLRDALSGGDAEAALGLRNTWTLAPGLKLGTSVERVHALSGAGQNENTALAFGLEYTANPLWKGSTRLELRDGANAQSLLHTVGVAARIARDWTILGRNTFSLQRTKDGDGEQVQERLQAGLAWRDSVANDKDLLARVEHKREEDGTQAGITLKRSTQILSLHGSWQPRRPFLVSGRYAAKWTTENSLGLTSKYRAQQVGGRLAWEFAPRWDLGVATSALIGGSGAAKHYGLGLELGYLVKTNLWVSAGYNFFGYKDEDLSEGEYTTKGPYVRLRYKFDESLFERAPAGGGK